MSDVATAPVLREMSDREMQAVQGGFFWVIFVPAMIEIAVGSEILRSWSESDLRKAERAANTR